MRSLQSMTHLRPSGVYSGVPLLHQIICPYPSSSIVTCNTHGSVHTIRKEICRTLMCRVHRYLLCSAIMVCLMGHIAVQTYVADCFLAVEATRHWPSFRRTLSPVCREWSRWVRRHALSRNMCIMRAMRHESDLALREDSLTRATTVLFSCASQL